VPECIDKPGVNLPDSWLTPEVSVNQKPWGARLKPVFHWYLYQLGRPRRDGGRQHRHPRTSDGGSHQGACASRAHRDCRLQLITIQPCEFGQAAIAVVINQQRRMAQINLFRIAAIRL
jgi:hypothetical protein